MDVDLSRAWDGGRPAVPAGGRALVAIRQERLELSWNLRLVAPPQVPEGPRGFRDRLWSHDVVELFLAPGRAEAPYVELEVAASGHWFAATFALPRQRERDLTGLLPVVLSDVDARRWRGRAEFPLPAIVEVVGRPPWKGLVAACLSAPSGPQASAGRVLLCWPPLPGPQADFHQPSRWATLLPA